jgi:phosphoesterase family protein
MIRSGQRSPVHAFPLIAIVACTGCALISSKTVIPESRKSNCPPVTASLERRQRFSSVLIIVLENQDYADVIADPYFASLAERGASFSDFHGIFHPSYANYLAMVSGRAYRTFGDHQRNLDDPTIADQLEAAAHIQDGRPPWRNYAEGYPGGCMLGPGTGRYVRKHVPFLSFTSIQRSPERCRNIVPGTDFDGGDASLLPRYMFYSPDLDDDGHDPPFDRPAGLLKASRWLERFLEPQLQNREFMRQTLTIVTFDESAATWRPDDNHIYTVFLGAMVKPGTYPRSYNHFNVLRTIEDNFCLEPLAEGDGCAAPIDVWKAGDDPGRYPTCTPAVVR